MLNVTLIVSGMCLFALFIFLKVASQHIMTFKIQPHGSTVALGFVGDDFKYRVYRYLFRLCEIWQVGIYNLVRNLDSSSFRLV